ncbi:hypothetical protein JCGZ_08668 [Jatropha curcas]|uniref:Uncharacterized protein n=1 Tax=Jatropha curcas TaxID=180498 RepID=A0A067KX15_JATCU|nr:uncharacterized protein LOC105635589 [Jatropha curcas]KDP36399.1 hypothetical protein JCGZ_08668 [Jatropha curcas]
MLEYTDHRRDSDEEEEALSLCDLPLEEEDDENDDKGSSNITSHANRRSSSEPPEFFEFFSNVSSDNMCSADDIIFCGKLIPFKDFKTHNNSPQDKIHLSFRRRSESLSGLHNSVARSNSINTTKLMMRNSRSLDYRKLWFSKTSSESDNSFDRNSSTRSIGKGDGVVKKMVKPRWYVLMFGVVKPPTEMELKDIKSRQIRRNMMFPPSVAETVKKPPINKCSSKLLKVLSCRDNTSVAVTTSFYMPRV